MVLRFEILKQLFALNNLSLVLFVKSLVDFANSFELVEILLCYMILVFHLIKIREKFTELQLVFGFQIENVAVKLDLLSVDLLPLFIVLLQQINHFSHLDFLTVELKVFVSEVLGLVF